MGKDTDSTGGRQLTLTHMFTLVKNLYPIKFAVHRKKNSDGWQLPKFTRKKVLHP